MEENPVRERVGPETVQLLSATSVALQEMVELFGTPDFTRIGFAAIATDDECTLIVTDWITDGVPVPDAPL